MWKGRFSKEPSELLKKIGESVSFDWRLCRHDILGSIAHARGLERAGILTKAELTKIERGLRSIEKDIAAGTFVFNPALEDVHMNIEAELTSRIGAVGAKLHTARSRNDQVALDLRLWVRDALGMVSAGAATLQEALVELATGCEAAEAVMPGYTHLQRAQPVPVAHHLLAYVEMLERDKGRCASALERLDEMPLGSGAIAGSTIALEREAVAQELGFSRVTQNSMDAVSDRDFAMESLSTLAILGVHLSRLCEDIVLWSSSEFGFIRLSDHHSTGSSLMPQKRNPDIAELVRGKTGRFTGNLVSLLTTMKGLPLAYNRDMQEDKEAVFDSFDTAILALAAMAEMVSEAEWNVERSTLAASDPLLLATDLADALVLGGVPFRQAHEIVGKLVAQAEADNMPLDKLDPEKFLTASPVLTHEIVDAVFDLRHAAESRKATGAPSPSNVQARLKHWRKVLSSQ